MSGISCWFSYRIVPLFSLSLLSMIVFQAQPLRAQVKAIPLGEAQSKAVEQSVLTSVDKNNKKTAQKKVEQLEEDEEEPSNVVRSPQKSQPRSTSDRPLVQKGNLGDVIPGTTEAKIQPEEWQFKALLRLSDRYDCAGEYPEDKPLTRSEFAKGLNSCLDNVSKLLAQAPANTDPVTKADLETIQKLQSEFAAELQTQAGKIESLETKIATLQKSQFSTTTKLAGEVIFAGTGVFSSSNNAGPAGNSQIGVKGTNNTTFQDRLRLILSSSFTGKDSLRLILSANNIQQLGYFGSVTRPTTLGGAPRNQFNGPLGTYEGLLADTKSPAFTDNGVLLTTATYRTPLSDQTALNVFAQSEGVFAIGLSSATNPYFESGGGNNSITRFGRRNTVYDYGDSGPGAAILHKLTPELEVGVAYTAIQGQDPSDSRGLFSGRYVAAGQLTYITPDKSFRTALTYANTYSPPGVAFGTATGSNLSNSTTGYGATADSLGLGTFYQFNPNFALNGWIGYSKHNYLPGQFSLGGSGDVWNWAIGAAFPNLGAKGNLGGILIGQEPRVSRLDSTVNLGNGLGVSDRDQSYHVEAFYQAKLNDNTEITPGILWITAPNSDTRNAGNLIGYLRTTFKF